MLGSVQSGIMIPAIVNRGELSPSLSGYFPPPPLVPTSRRSPFGCCAAAMIHCKSQFDVVS